MDYIKKLTIHNKKKKMNIKLLKLKKILNKSNLGIKKFE